MAKQKRQLREPIDALTAELRLGVRVWRAIRPHVTCFKLDDGELFDWGEIREQTARRARPEPSRGATA